MKRILQFLPLLFIAGLGVSPIAQATGLSIAAAVPLSIIAVLALAYLAVNGPRITGVTVNGINTEMWLPQVVPTLFKNNEFLLRSTDHSSYVNALTVHIPQAAAGRDWVKNRSKGGQPVDTYQRTDTVVDYSIDEWTSDPMLITDAEEKQLSYDKRASVLDQMMRIGRQTIADNLLYYWAATAGSTANILRTSGVQNNDIAAGIIPTSYGLTSGATGSRKVTGLYDLKRAHALLDSLNVPREGRCALYSANRYQELLDDIVVSKYRDAAGVMDMANGVVNKVMGTDIYVRATTVTYDNTATPVRKAVGAATAATDNDSVLVWHPDFVARAIGDMKLYYNPDQAVYYGDVMSALVRMGGSKVYTAELGIVSIVQETAS